MRAQSEQQNARDEAESQARQAESQRKAAEAKQRNAEPTFGQRFSDKVNKGIPQTVFEATRDGLEKDTGLQTRVPGEGLVSTRR